MIRTGVVSVTFRALPAREVISLAARGGLSLVEWGGDIHVPHGDTGKAREVARLTREAGLETAAYGSYYRAGCENDFTFEAVLETALALGAPVIRVWAGRKSSAEAEGEYRRRVSEDLGRVARLASAAGPRVACEFHVGTLTDTTDSALRLLEENAGANLAAYWQPPAGADDRECLAGLGAMLPRLAHVHVFHWPGGERRPLGEGAERWRSFLARLAAGPGDYGALLEFVRDSDPAVFLRDAATLNELVAGTGAGCPAAK